MDKSEESSSRFIVWQRAMWFGLAFWGGAVLSRYLSISDSSYVPFWLPSGLYLGVLLLSPTRNWPQFMLAALLGNIAFDLSHGAQFLVILSFYASNTSQAVIGALLIRKLVIYRPELINLRVFFLIVLFSAGVAPVLGAVAGASTLLTFGMSQSFLDSWVIWAGNTAMSNLLVIPFVLVWFNRKLFGNPFFSRWRVAEFAGLTGGLALASWYLFAETDGIMSPRKLLLELFLIWAAVRFGLRGVTIVILLLAVLTAFFTTRFLTGLSPEQVASGTYIGVLQVFLGVSALIALVPTIVIAERDHHLVGLNQSYVRTRLATETTGVGIWEWNVETGVVQWDAEMFRIYGVPPTDDGFVPYSTWRESVVPEDLAREEAVLQETIHTHKQSRREFRIRRRDTGDIRIVQAIDTIRLNERGSTQYVVGTNLDITERKQAEAALQESESQFRSLIEDLDVGVVLISPDDQIVVSNSAACRILGLTHDQLHGEAAKDPRWEIVNADGNLFSPEEIPFSVVARTRQQLLNVTVGSRNQGTGHRTWMQVNGTPRLNLDGSLEHVVLTFVDITERRRAEDALLESKMRLRRITDAVPGVVYQYHLDPDGTQGFVFVSGGATELVGYSPEEWIADPELIWERIHSEDISALRQTVLESARNGTPWSEDFRVLTKSGVSRWVRGRSIPEPLQADSRVTWNGLLTDVTAERNADEQLRARDALLRKLSEQVPGVIYQYQQWPDGRSCFPYASEGIRDIYEVTPEEVRDSAAIVFSRLHPDDIDRIAQSIQVSFETQSVWRCEYRVLLPVKGLRWLDGHAVPERMPDGSTIWHGYIGDVTDRKQAEDAIRESENRFRTLIEDLDVGVVLQDEKDHVLVSNNAAATTLGMTADQLRGVTSMDPRWELVREDETPLPLDQVPSVLAARTRRPVRNIVIGTRNFETGNRTWLQLNATPRLNADGSLRHVLVSLVDITARKQAEAELVMRDRAIRAVNQGIVITDPSLPNNPVIYASPGFERMTGYPPSEFVGLNCRMLQGPETDRAEVARISEAVRSGVSYSGELLNYRKDGSTFWNELSITPVRDSSGKLVRFVGIQSDVTTRRSLEDQLRHAQKMEAIGLLAGGVAHDFNNLLTVINGYSELLLMNFAPDDPLRDHLTMILQAGELAAALTQQLLAFSHRSIVAPQVLDVNDLVESCNRMLRRLIGEDVALASVLSSAQCLVRIDPGQMEQVIMNLAVNARDAMPQGGRLTIETGREQVLVATPDCAPGRYIRLVITDTGTGMTDEVKRRIFEPFFTTKGLGKGTGLGLAMVYGIVNQAGGCVRVDSIVGQGTTFTLLIPEVPASSALRLNNEVKPVAPLGTETILLAEDEDEVRKLAVRILEMQGYTVISAGTGAAALSTAANYRGIIHIIVSDVVMPDLGGWALVQAVREHRPEVRVLYMSGYTDDAVIRHGVAEADAFLQKPFTPLTLARKIREVLDAAHQG